MNAYWSEDSGNTHTSALQRGEPVTFHAHPSDHERTGTITGVCKPRGTWQYDCTDDRGRLYLGVWSVTRRGDHD